MKNELNIMRISKEREARVRAREREGVCVCVSRERCV